MYNFHFFLDNSVSSSNQYCELRSISNEIELGELEMSGASSGFNGLSIFAYLFCHISGDILSIKFFDRETEAAYSSVLASWAFKREIRRKWPTLYQATNLGNKRVYGDFFFFEYDGVGFLGTKFDYKSYSQSAKAFQEYFENKLLFLLRQYLVVRHEMDANPLSRVNIVANFISDEIKWVKNVNKYFNLVENVYDILNRFLQ